MSKYPTVTQQAEIQQWELWKQYSIRIERSTLCNILNTDKPTREQLSNWLYTEHSVLKSEYVIAPTYGNPQYWEPAWEIRFARSETYAAMVLGGILAPK